ncbi:kinase-like protein [Wolfiporia cocos MD-104 SS10]|uniref:Kinase-like protein n=1 Tax=Wolfiporia cocos (strain MD-104) TaxID=742152 RepID=A0A2H3JQY7_WOLCO|nr:kinase-like protein [Wolfiporia cocos MD-104 SS10]
MALSPDDETAKCAFYLLKRTCERYFRFPQSYYLAPGTVKWGSHPSAYGGNGRVFEGRFQERRVAVKEIYYKAEAERPTSSADFAKEVVIWKQLRHRSIVPLLGVIVPRRPGPCFMVSPWMSRGNLTEYIRLNPKANKLRLILDIVSGLEFLHSHNVIHGDLKADNILVDDEGLARLTDFGVTRQKLFLWCATRSASVAGSTWHYAAPERLDPEGSSLGAEHLLWQSDIYSLSLVMWEIYAQQRVFPEYHGLAIVRAVAIDKKRPGHTPQMDVNGLTDPIWNMMQECWQHDYKLRPTSKKVLRSLEAQVPECNTCSSQATDTF